MAESTTPSEALREVRRLLADVLEATEQARLPVSQIMRLLDVVEGGLQQEAKTGRSAPRGHEPRRYTIERTAAGEVLTEGREGGKSPPFRVSKAIYDAVAQVLADSGEPLGFSDIMERTVKTSSVPPGDFQIRTCLRFWLAADPPLIARGKSMYSPVSRTDFLTKAESRWMSFDRPR